MQPRTRRGRGFRGVKYLIPILYGLMACSIPSTETVAPAVCEEVGSPVPPHTKSNHICCISGESCKHFTCDSASGACCENADGGAGPAPECSP